MKTSLLISLLLIIGPLGILAQQKPNIVFIYADDLGYGDISCYGATKIKTPHIDDLAKNGLLFTNTHASSATCTPSRYSLLTGQYAWRKQGTGVTPGDAALLIKPGVTTLPAVLHQSGYITAAIGKWHLGLGDENGPDWNGIIKPGPLEIGFDYSFIIPATGDRVPCVFVENHAVVGLDINDPIHVSYKQKLEASVQYDPNNAVMKSSNGHNQSLINGIGRIGYMTGGKSAIWNDEEIANTLTTKASNFIIDNKNKPFFLYLATHDIHVPRVPNKRFVGKSGMGARGDAILQLDWTVGKIKSLLDSLHLTKNTFLIFSSDNGPVLDDGYVDSAVEKLNGHTPAGPLRGGKYSVFDAGTCVPFIISYPGKIKQDVSDALISQVDLLASFASLCNYPLTKNDAPDSYDLLNALLGKSKKGREHLIEHAGTFAVIKGNWKYIEHSNREPYDKYVNIELGNSKMPQLYDMEKDRGEKNNQAEKYPEKAKEMAELMKKVKDPSFRMRN